jgi:hypothetical protein
VRPADRTDSAHHHTLIASQGLTLLAILLGGPLLAARVGGALPAILVAVVLIAGLLASLWRIGLAFERAWLASYGVPLLGEQAPGRSPGDDAASLRDEELTSRSELVGVSETSAPVG